MILQLLKEDCIIAKNYVVAVILIGVGLPVLLVRSPKRKICIQKQPLCFVPLLIIGENW